MAGVAGTTQAPQQQMKGQVEEEEGEEDEDGEASDVLSNLRDLTLSTLAKRVGLQGVCVRRACVCCVCFRLSLLNSIVIRH